MKVFFTPRIYVLASVLMLLSLFSAHAQQAKKISLQGFLKDANGKAVADGQQSITFKLYTQDAGGTAEWTEDQDINVFGGVYSTHLGKTVPLENLNWGASTYYVGVTVQGTELTPRTELTFAPYSLGSPKAQEVVCSGAVGDVKHSILNPEQFRQVNGNCWVPMDGRALATTDKLRQITSRTNVPNGGGLFIRSQEFINTYYDDDRDVNSPIAQVQNEAFGSHTHTASTNTAGSHTHTYWDWYSSNSSRQYTTSANPYTQKMVDWEADAAETTSSAGDHSHTVTIASTGGNETRPDNINFWVYIRIN